VDRYKISDRKTGIAKQTLHRIFIHPDG